MSIAEVTQVKKFQQAARIMNEITARFYFFARSTLALCSRDTAAVDVADLSSALLTFARSRNAW